MKVMEPSPIVTQLVRRDGCRIYWPGVLITSVASTVVCLVGQVGYLYLFPVEIIRRLQIVI